jgi:hypothetical protein
MNLSDVISRARYLYVHDRHSFWQNCIKLLRNPLLFRQSLSSKQISYSQCGEDLYLQAMIPKTKGIYVDIGAYNPKYLSNTYLFYKQ